MSEKNNRFEDLHVWQEGISLATQIFKELQDCTEYELRDQLQKSAISISSRIAEGYERNSNNEFVRFLNMSKSSTGEVRSQLYLCKDLNIIEEGKCDDFIEHTRKISAMLYNLIKSRMENSQ